MTLHVPNRMEPRDDEAAIKIGDRFYIMYRGAIYNIPWDDFIDACKPIWPPCEAKSRKPKRTYLQRIWKWITP